MRLPSSFLLFIPLICHGLFYDAVQPRQSWPASRLMRRYLDNSKEWSESGNVVHRAVVVDPHPVPVDPDPHGTGTGDGGTGASGTNTGGNGANSHDGASGGGTDGGTTSGSQSTDGGLTDGQQTTDGGLTDGSSNTGNSGNNNAGGQQGANTDQISVDPGPPDLNLKPPLPGTTEPEIDVEPPKGQDPNAKDPDPSTFPLCDPAPARRWLFRKRGPSRGCATRSSSADDGPKYDGWGSAKGRFFQIKRGSDGKSYLFAKTTSDSWRLDTETPVNRISDSKIVGVAVQAKGQRYVFIRDGKGSASGKLVDYDATLERYEDSKAEAASKSKISAAMESYMDRRKEAAGSSYRPPAKREADYKAMEHKLDTQMCTNAKAKQEWERQSKIYHSNYQDVPMNKPGMNTINHGQTKPFYSAYKDAKNPSYENLDSDWETHEIYSTNPDKKGKRSSSPTIQSKEYVSRGGGQANTVNMQRFAKNDDRKYDRNGKRRADANSESIPVFSQGMQRTVDMARRVHPNIRDEDIGGMTSRFDGISIVNQDTLTSIDDSFRGVGADPTRAYRFERRSSDSATARGFENILSTPNFRGEPERAYQYPQYFRPSHEITAIEARPDTTGMPGGQPAYASVIYGEKPGKQRPVYKGRKRSETHVTSLQSRNATTDPLQEWLEMYDMPYDWEEEPW